MAPRGNSSTDTSAYYDVIPNAHSLEQSAFFNATPECCNSTCGDFRRFCELPGCRHLSPYCATSSAKYDTFALGSSHDNTGISKSITGELLVPLCFLGFILLIGFFLLIIYLRERRALYYTQQGYSGITTPRDGRCFYPIPCHGHWHFNQPERVVRGEHNSSCCSSIAVTPSTLSPREIDQKPWFDYPIPKPESPVEYQPVAERSSLHLQSPCEDVFTNKSASDETLYTTCDCDRNHDTSV